MNCNLKISVIIPVYNTADYLCRCLNSILNNDYNNFEIICINDGSTDNSLEILQEYKNKEDRILLIDVPNGGISRARNLGLDYATGDYVCFIDSDDWIHSRFFSRMINVVAEGDFDIVFCEYIRVDDLVEEETIVTEKERGVCLSSKNALDIHTFKSFVWGRLYRRQLFEKTCFIEDVKISEDKLFNVLLVSRNPQLHILYLNERLYYYFNRRNSAINTSHSMDFKALSYIYLDYAENSTDILFKDIFLTEAFKNTFSARYGLMVEKDVSVKHEMDLLVKRCLSLEKLQRPFPLKKAILLRLFAYFPFLYRWFRILNDPTMLVWEKAKKEELKRQK